MVKAVTKCKHKDRPTKKLQKTQTHRRGIETFNLSVNGDFETSMHKRKCSIEEDGKHCNITPRTIHKI